MGSSIQKDSYALAAQEDRCSPRMQISIPSMLRPSGTKGYQTVVHDLSLSGFSATAIGRLHPGSKCWLTLPGLESQEAEVLWWENGRIGAAFANLLSPIVFDAIIAKWSTEGG